MNSAAKLLSSTTTNHRSCPILLSGVASTKGLRFITSPVGSMKAKIDGSLGILIASPI